MTDRHDQVPLREERGQAAITLVGAVIAIFFVVALFAQFGSAFVAKGRDQRSADLAAIAAARQLASDHWRTYVPAVLPNGMPNPTHLSEAEYRSRARATAMRSIRANAGRESAKRVSFDGGGAPTSVTVTVERKHRVQVPGSEESAGSANRSVRIQTTATAELRFAFADLPDPRPSDASGGGYDGPLAYRQGKPMRPDVAETFDRLAAAARAAGHSLTVNSGFRSDAEQARLFAQNPNPKWVAPPGTSLHRYGTELDLGPPAAYGWLSANARRFGFIKRYACLTCPISQTRVQQPLRAI